MVIAIIVLSVLLIITIIVCIRMSITYSRESMEYTAVCMSHNILAQFLVYLNDVLDKNIILNTLTNVVKIQSNNGQLYLRYVGEDSKSRDNERLGGCRC